MPDRIPLLLLMVFLISSCQRPHQEAPNVLLAIADDWSWPHASIAGTEGIHTPAFDRIARDGILFTHAYCSAPSCTPSRGALLTGQYHWRLGQNANLWSTLDAGFEVYPDLLEEAGYKVGYTGKGWGPGMYQKGGRNRNPAGPQFNEKTIDAPPGISRVDYSGNFKAFLGKKTAGQPFCFWFGAFEPHRVYAPGSGLEQGKDPAQITVPLCLPDDETVRKDIIDYYSEIEWFDSQLGQMIQHLEEFDLLEQTIIIVTSDNGMPFPRCKSNLYDLGTRVPLAIFMASNRKEGRIVEDLVSLTDLAPTILEAAGLPVPEEMTGQSLLPYFNTRREGVVFAERNAILTGKERHAWVRQGGLGYPMRAIRTHDFLYIYNFEPDRWPAGDPNDFDHLRPNQPYGDIDASPTKTYMMEHHEQMGDRFMLAFLKRPQEELYELDSDPFQLVNLAEDPKYQDIRDRLYQRLMNMLEETSDPRVLGRGDAFDQMPYYRNGFIQNAPN